MFASSSRPPRRFELLFLFILKFTVSLRAFYNCAPQYLWSFFCFCTRPQFYYISFALSVMCRAARPRIIRIVVIHFFFFFFIVSERTQIYLSICILCSRCCRFAIISEKNVLLYCSSSIMCESLLR